MGINLGNLTPEPTSDIKAQVSNTAPMPNTTPVTSTPAPEIVLPNGVEKVDRGGGMVSLNLKKGVSLDLTKTLPTLDRVKVGLGWDTTADLDVFALLMRNGKISSGADVIFFNQPNGQGIHLSGDCRNGLDTTGVDDETIELTLSQIAPDVTEVGIFVNIYDATTKNLNFGMVNGAYTRIVDANTDKEEAIYVLSDNDAALYNAFHFVTFKRNGSGWSFDTVSKGLNGDVQQIANQYC